MIQASGRGARATWLILARGLGSAARSVGHARDIEPGHRRDGIALTLMGIAVVVAASCWFGAARPVGEWIDGGVRMVIGSAVVLVPIVAVATAVTLMRSQPDPVTRPRLILGVTMVGLPMLGLWHLWAGSPTTSAARQHAAGFVGFAIGGPLSDGLTAWIAAPLLFLGVLFGLLLLSGMTVRELPERLRHLVGARGFIDKPWDDDPVPLPDEPPDDEAVDSADDEEPTEPAVDVAPKSSRRRASRNASKPEHPGPRPRRRRALHAAVTGSAHRR